MTTMQFNTGLLCLIIALGFASLVDCHRGGGGGGGWGSDSGEGWGGRRAGGHSHGHGHGHGGHGWGWGDSTTTTKSPAGEQKTLHNLYKAALAEGGRVIIYAGGDTPGQQDGFKVAFEKKFPNMTADVIVDYSKFHDARIDNQLATNTLIPDVVQLQTLQDFPRWKKEGVLLKYKPLGFDQVYDQFKDPDGHFTGIFVDAFSNLVNRKMLPNRATWPREGTDYLRSDLKGKIILAYPNDDDAVLFWFKLMVDKYGWTFVDSFVKQQPHLVRGTQEPFDAVEQGRYPVATGVDGVLVADRNSKTVFVLPRVDPFVSWAQTAAIFKNAKHPAAAKLYLSWVLTTKFQRDNWFMWSVRRDVPVPKGAKNIFDYGSQTDPLAFGKWMADRAAVERFRTEISLYFGEVQGEPSPGHPGLHPEHALPH